jgi:glycosyltransferase involved in cell wall biosynthesis
MDEPSRRTDQPLRIALFTDTLGDVNGVCRFIQNTASMANQTDRDLRVYTSTRFPVPGWRNILNFPPRLATTMPGYQNLELALPPTGPMIRAAIDQQPHVVHVSTPGPVGMAGLRAARRLGVPVLGVYHTDFPAYIEKLFDDTVCTWACTQHMKHVYRRFATIFTRSEDYRVALDRLGIPRSRMQTLRPGIDIELFHRRHRDPGIWRTQAGVSPATLKVLYCGRVSVEKNMPLLADAWKLAAAELSRRSVGAELIVIGDGPYRATMQRELDPHGARFLGFKHGKELSALYASSDLFVFPSTTDTLGQVVMESQSSGLPVIVTDQGGPKEVVRDGVTGLVLRADDPAEWARRIVALLTDHEQRRRMGEAAHQSMQDYSFRASFDHYWSVHERCRAEHAG